MHGILEKLLVDYLSTLGLQDLVESILLVPAAISGFAGLRPRHVPGRCSPARFPQSTLRLSGSLSHPLHVLLLPSRVRPSLEKTGQTIPAASLESSRTRGPRLKEGDDSSRNEGHTAFFAPGEEVIELRSDPFDTDGDDSRRPRLFHRDLGTISVREPESIGL
ncbi:hypothetical protein KM043_011136 [Ampulex compressa]|nr:hypothetical protein KM043_011136 [Ampulex compressa]